MAFETYPIVINLFPLLIIVPTAISFLIAYALSQGWIKPVHGDISRLMKRARLILVLVIGIPVLLMIIVPLLGFWLDIEVLAWSFYIFHGLVHIEEVILVGVFLGFVLAVGYYTRGVSGFCLAVFLILILPAWAVLSTGNAGAILGFVLDGFDFFLLFILIFSWEPTWLMKRLIGGEEEPKRSAIATISRDVARGYVAESIGSLRTRLVTDGDMIAKEAIEVLQETEGSIGALISEAVAQLETPKSMEYQGSDDPVEYPVFDSYEASLRRAVMSKQPRLRGVWMLTNSEFNRRVRLNRFVYLILLSALITLTLGALTDLSLYANQWMAILSTGTIIISLVLALFDSTFMSKRMSTNFIVRQVLRALSGIDEFLIDEPSRDEELTELAERNHMPEFKESEGETAFLTDDHLADASGHTRKFLEKVRAGKNEVYEESIIPLYIGAAGILMSFPTGMVAILTSSGPLPLFNDILLILFLLGIPFITAGALWWLSWTRERSFYGVRRSILASAISYLDIKEAGVQNIGFVTYPTPPGHVALIRLRGPTAARITLEKLGKSTSIQRDPALTRETIEIEGRMMRMIWWTIPIALVATVVIFLISTSFYLDVLMLSLLGFLVISLIWGYSSYYRRKQSLLLEETQSSSNEPIERLSQILSLIEMEYKFPLRVHVIGNHKEFLYTGTTFATTTGVILREAVFLPK